jgi:hypothetical protein
MSSELGGLALTAGQWFAYRVPLLSLIVLVFYFAIRGWNSGRDLLLIWGLSTLTYGLLATRGDSLGWAVGFSLTAALFTASAVRAFPLRRSAPQAIRRWAPRSRTVAIVELLGPLAATAVWVADNPDTTPLALAGSLLCYVVVVAEAVTLHRSGSKAGTT